MKINGKELEFDIVRYLESKKITYNMVGSNAMVCCPWHKEKNPSCGIDTRTGVYHCLSGSCGVKGNVANLVQKIENYDTYEDAEHWLISRYGTNPDDIEGPLELDFTEENTNQPLCYIDEETLKALDFRHPYLGSRGITELWQQRFRIGFDKNSYAISMPWFDRFGRCVGIKYRGVLEKKFWWTNPNEHLGLGANKITMFGMHHVFRKKVTTVVVVESEIDAIYCWLCGFPALALGTSSITKAQLEELKNTYVDSVIIATDNDAAGRKVAAQLERELTWINDISRVNWELFPTAKDVNDLSSEDLNTLIANPVSALLSTIG